MQVKTDVKIFMEFNSATDGVVNVRSDGNKRLQFTAPQVVGTMCKCNWILRTVKVGRKEALLFQ